MFAQIVVDDSNACTDDSCDMETGVIHVQIACEDNDVCTKNLCVATEGCIYLPIADCCHDDAECDDGDVCNGVETCGDNKCVAGQKLICNDFSVCTTDSCDPSKGCVFEPISGCCKTDVDCNDFNQCTGDACVKSTGECVHFGIPGDCNDGDECTTNDACKNSECVGGPALDCNDSSVCTADSCDTATGCQHSAVPDGEPCTDNTVCNGAEMCQSGQCKSGVALNCDDVDICTADSCDTADGCKHSAEPDNDSDGPCDLADNCQSVANADQSDMDKDSVGDICDAVNTCNLSTAGLPAWYYQISPMCVNGCFVGDEMVCIKCISSHNNCTWNSDGDWVGPICQGDCNDGYSGITNECWPGGQIPPVCADPWTPQ